MAPRIAGEGLVDAANPADIARATRSAARAAVSGMDAPALLVGFVSGGASRVDPAVMLECARLVRVVAPSSPVVLVEASAALSSQGEREGAAAASVIALSSSVVSAKVHDVREGTARSLHRARIAESLRSSTARLGLCFLAPPAHSLESLSGLQQSELADVAGAGVSRVVVATSEEPPHAADIAVVALTTRLGVSVVTSTAAQVVGPWMRLTDVDGTTLLRSERGRMLDVLSQTIESQGRREPVILAVRSDDPSRPPLLRNIAGADPARGAITITDALPEGAEVAFAVRDASAVRHDHQQRLTALARGLKGAIPAAALMLTGAGRGRLLFGQPDVDVAAFRARFPGVPMAGMHAAFGVAPWDGHPRLQLFSAVTALLYRPS